MNEQVFEGPAHAGTPLLLKREARIHLDVRTARCLPPAKGSRQLGGLARLLPKVSAFGHQELQGSLAALGFQEDIVRDPVEPGR